MSKSKSIRVASRAHTALSLSEPHPNPEKLGDSPALRSIVLAGASHPGAETVTEDVDPDVFKAWADANPNHPWLTTGLIREVPADYVPGDMQFGHEIALEAASKDKDETKAAKEGSSIEGEAPVSGEDMTPTSDTPADDSPGSEPRHAAHPGEPEPARRGRRSGV